MFLFDRTYTNQACVLFICFMTIKYTTLGSRFFRSPAKAANAPLYLLLVGTAVTAAAALGLGASSYQLPFPGDSPLSSSAAKIRSGVHGVVRCSRALYTINFVVLDYKYSLRGPEPHSKEYRSKLSQVHLRSAKRFLKLCEKNKGFYVKAGQFVSSLQQVPKEYSAILSTLQDQAVPYHFKDIQEVIVKSLGKELSEVFLSFDEKPIAAASIAQVHHALLRDNQEVAVKVQYPGLEQQMTIDFTTMAILSKSIAWIFPDFRFEWLASEFEKAMSLELDFLQEAKNSERTARNFKNNETIRVPHIFWDLTTSQVLTMQFCNGHKVDDLEFLRQSGINPKKVAKALMDVFAEMIFIHGFLHGDPHPGNILVSPEGPKGFSLVILDHGIYKELDEKFRLDYCQLWKALIFLNAHEIQQLGEQFGLGKYTRYLPVIFTGRTIESKSALGEQMSVEEKRNLKQELHSLNMGDFSSFVESLPPDFLTILRADGLLRSITGKLGASRSVRLLTYAKHAISGLATKNSTESGSTIKHAISKVRTSVNCIQLRGLLEILELLSRLEDLGCSVANKFKWFHFKVVQFLHRSFSTLKL